MTSSVVAELVLELQSTTENLRPIAMRDRLAQASMAWQLATSKMLLQRLPPNLDKVVAAGKCLASRRTGNRFQRSFP